MTRTASILASIAVLALAACAGAPTGEQPGAAVEDRKPEPVAAAKPAAEVKPAPAPAVAAKPLPVDLTKPKTAAVSPLKDPANPLSRRQIFFDFDSYEVKPEFRSLVELHARHLRDNPKERMLIQGNTDERGGREYNLALGQRRADAVRRMMVLIGAREEQIEAVSLGEEKPIMEGSSEEAWAQNRRSDLLYSGEF